MMTFFLGEKRDRTFKTCESLNSSDLHDNVFQGKKETEHSKPVKVYITSDFHDLF